MFVNFKIILLSLFVVSVLTFEHNLYKSKKLWKGIPEKLSQISKRSIDELFDEKSENTSENPDSIVTKDSTETPIDVIKDDGNEVIKEVPKEVVKEDTKEEVKKEGERIEREGEEEERPVVTPQTPKEVEATTPHTPTPLPPITQSTVPSVPTATHPTVPTNRPLFPFQPTYPTNSFPNYWQNPNWGNWGRFVPTHTSNWPQQQWPSFNWPSQPSVPQMPSYSPSTLTPARYSPGSFGMIPTSGIQTFSFIVPQNPYPGGRGFQYPGSRPSVPTYSGFQPGYQPRFVPSGGQTPGYYPGFGGQSPGNYPSYGGQDPRYGGQEPGYGGQDPRYGGQEPTYGKQDPRYGGQEPRYRGQEPRYYPGTGGQSPPAQPGADPNRPMGPMGPEFNDPDVTMIDTNQMPANSIGRGFPGKVRRIIVSAK